MVMEFPDNVLNLDGHQNNGAQLKQFIQVNTSSWFLRQPHTGSCFPLIHAFASVGGYHSWSDIEDMSAPMCNYVSVAKYAGCLRVLYRTAFIRWCLVRRQFLRI